MSNYNSTYRDIGIHCIMLLIAFITSSAAANSTVPTIVTIDRSKAVGQIDITSGTTPTGAKVYQVPINLSNGMNEFVPQIGFLYNSQAGNSNLGIGWSLSGISQITRIPKNIYYDGIVQEIKMDKDDAFTLDGRRMILLPEESTSTYNAYQTDEGNIKIKGFISNNNISSFEVYYPEGKVASFGLYGTNFKNIHYAISSSQDRFGNSIDYSYRSASTTPTVEKISYNGNSIDFTYLSRDRSYSEYAHGETFTYSHLLNKVTLKEGGVTTGEYTLDYETYNNRYLLKKIGYGSGSDSLNPLTFYYGTENQSKKTFSSSSSQLLEWYPTGNQNQLNITTGKFDYDNDSDGIFAYPYKNPYYVKADGGYYFENQYTGEEKILLYSGLGDSFGSPMPNLVTGEGFIDIFTVDLDGSQEEKIVKVNNVVNGYDDKITFTVYGTSAFAGIVQLYTRSYSFSTTLTNSAGKRSVQPKYYYPGDFDGDGKMEILAVSANTPLDNFNRSTQWYVFDLENDKILFTGTIYPFVATYTGENNMDPTVAHNSTDKMLVGDFNGDGKSELLHIGAGGTHIFSFAQTEEGWISLTGGSNITLNRSGVANRELYGGDFNGDGKTDFALSPSRLEDSSRWNLGIAKGGGHFLYTSSELCKQTNEEGGGHTFVDINSDGVTDLVDYTKTGFTCYILNTSGQLSEKISYTYSDSDRILVPANINSRNFTSSLTSLKGGKVERFSLDREDDKEVMLSGMVNSFGVIEENEYRTIKNRPSSVYRTRSNDDFYIMGHDAVFPYVNIQESIHVLSSSSKRVNNQVIGNETFSYKNAVLHRQGLGFCGFASVSSVDMDGYISERHYDPFNFGMMTYEKTKETESFFTNSAETDGNKVLHRHVKTVQSEDLATGVVSTTNYTYNKYDNVITEDTSYDDGISVNKTYMYYINNAFNKAYCTNFVIEEKETKTVGEDTYERRFSILDFECLKPLTTEERIDGNIVCEKYYEYDGNGNMIHEDEYMYGSSNSLSRSYEYDEKGRLIKQTDYTGLSEEFTYDELGRKATSTDIRGNVTTYQYDSFGRPVKISYPDDTVETNTFAWSLMSGEAYRIGKTDRSFGIVTLSYDALDREIRVSDRRFDGRTRHVDKVYDSYGRIIKESSPYMTIISAWKETQYDQFGRPLFESSQDGRTSTYSYNGNSVTAVSNGMTITRHYDSLGNLIKVEDAAGSVDFTLGADGQPLKITAPGNVSVTLAYDQYRRRISMTDPSSSTTTFTFDENGNLASQKSANGKTVNYEYDQYNRKSKMSSTDFTVTYEYDDFGELVSESATNGTSRLTTYDSVGRVETVTYNEADGNNLIKEFSYSNGNVSEIKYSYEAYGDLREEYEYSYGHRKSVKADGECIYELISENELGQITEVKTGPVTRKYGYTETGLGLYRKSYVGTEIIQDFEYSYDENSTNMISRKMGSLSETFGYDELNRLKTNGTVDINYDIKGNIITKTGVGSFSYTNAQKPYLITQGESSTGAISSEDLKLAYSQAGRVYSISEGDYTYKITYNYNNDRVKTTLAEKATGSIPRFTWYYLGDCLEIDDAYISKTKLYLMGDYYESPAVMVTDRSGHHIVYVLRDHLGSVTHVVDYDGKVLDRLSYDPWGRIRNSSTGAYYFHGKDPEPYLRRGFCGHEHLAEIALINMNARIYDPVIGRFVSADPHIQNPEMFQNFNRYAYALNNPLSYVDRDGEFLGTIFTAIFELFKNIFTRGVNFDKYRWNRTKMAAKIDWSMFQGSFGQVLNKLTWGFLPSAVGNLIAHGYNVAGKINNFTRMSGDGCIALAGATKGNAAVTVGHYSMGPDKYEASWKDHLFVHEYGHYLQSQLFGPLFLPHIGIPSLLSATFNPSGHQNRWFEVDASKRGAEYFDNRFGKGAENYDKWSINFFNKEAFDKGTETLYENPRTGKIIERAYPTHGTNVVFWDFIL